MIYTTYFAKLKSLPENIVPVSICGKAPAGYKGLQYKVLAPRYDFFMKWKETQDNDYYIQCYREQVLSKLKANDVINTLYTMSNGKDIALVCYEKPQDFCHRHIVADWLCANGIHCDEYVYDATIKTCIVDIYGNEHIIIRDKQDKKHKDNI